MESKLKILCVFIVLMISCVHAGIQLNVYQDEIDSSSVIVNIEVVDIASLDDLKDLKLKYSIAELLIIDMEAILELNLNQNYTISSLQPGVDVKVLVSATIAGNYTESKLNYTQVPDTVKDIKVTNIVNKIAYFTFNRPNGFYDQLKYECLTTSLAVFSQGSLSYEATNGTCSNLTTGEYFSIGFKTIKGNELTLSTEDTQIVPSIDCAFLAYASETNSITWVQPADGLVDSYFIQIFQTDTGEGVLNTTVYSPNTTFEFPKLEYDTSHEIHVQSVVWNIKDKNYCILPFISPPCPVIYHTTDISIGDLSDLDTVHISISNQTFDPLDKIDYIQVYVDTGNEDCLKRNYSDTFDENCFIAMNESKSVWDWTEETLTIKLSKVEKCTKNICNAKLKMKTTYYVTLKAINDCSFEFSNRLQIKVEEPFPIAMSVGISLGVAVGIVFIGIIALVIWRQKSNKKTSRRELLHNSSFDDLSSPKPFDIERIDEKIRVLSTDSNIGFANEFQIIDTYSPKCDVRESTNPRMLLDRYINISADGIFERTRVKITPTTENGDDYINANYVTGLNGEREYISTQGPLPNTMNEFWQMIHEQQVDFIIMLTVCVDKYGKKCEKYWPDLNETIEYGDYVVSNSSEIKKQDYVIRFFKLRHKGGPLRIITQYQYITWDDHSTPESTSSVLDFLRVVRTDIKSKSSNSPIVIHCSAGVGRSGTFIALDRVIQQIKTTGKVDIFENVLKIRRDRYLLVQTENQYMSLYLIVKEYYKRELNTASVTL